MANEPPAETLDKLKEVFKEHEGNRGHLLIVLQKIQAIYGYVPPFTFDMVAQVLGATKSEIYGVLTFYNRFHLTPRGKHTIRACRGTACHFKGAPSIIETEDFHFSLEEVACLGACGISPVMAVDEETFGNLTPARAAEVLSQYQAQAAQPTAAGPSGDGGEKQKAN
jgi:NADH-quinone oxidoreductase subunit E